MVTTDTFSILKFHENRPDSLRLNAGIEQCLPLKQQRVRIRQRVSRCDSYTFFNALTAPKWLDQVESLLPEHRERLFPPIETLSMFLNQALSADRSCQQAVDESAIMRLTQGLPQCSTHTGAYCRAR